MNCADYRRLIPKESSETVHEVLAVIEDGQGQEVQVAHIKNSDTPGLTEALSGPNAEGWNKAIDDEYQLLVDADVFDLVPRPRDKVVTAGIWILKYKRCADGSIERLKARYCAKGCSQVHGIDYNNTWAPTAQHATVKLLFVLAAKHDLPIRHVDIKCAFLNVDLEEEVYVEQPPLRGTGDKNFVWRLKKAIYRLKQAPRQ